MFISKHRRLAQQDGGGVQYLPGHVEPFVDLVIDEYLPQGGRLLDLGGGGLRFAIPVALSGREISVVDLDRSGLDVEMVVRRINENDGTHLDAAVLSRHIDVHEGEALEFLRDQPAHYSLISAFRVAHFLTPEEIAELFRLTHRSLSASGLFVISAMTPYNLPGRSEFNEVYRDSTPVSSDAPLYRSFRDDPVSSQTRAAHNLSRVVHLVDSDFIRDQAQRTGYEVLIDAHQSTRIVAGFILRKKAG